MKLLQHSLVRSVFGNTGARAWTTTLLSMSLIASLVLADIANAAATVTQTATGGSQLSADTAVNGGSNTGTVLGSIVITEGASGDIGGGATGTLIFRLPTGFQWDVSVAPDAAVSGTGCAGLSFGTATFGNQGGSEPNLVKFPINAVSTSKCVATFGGVIAFKVKPINATPLPAAGFIYLSDNPNSAPIAGLQVGSNGTNFGAIGEVAGAVSQSASTIVASPTSVAADGNATSAITVTLKDGHTNAVSGKTVTLTSNRGSQDTITPASAVTSGSGTATFSVRSNVSGTAVFTATADSLTWTVSVTFTASGVSDAKSTVAASPTSVPANGSASSTITVVLRDAGNNAVGGKTVTLASSRGSNDSITPSSATTNSGGTATFSVTSTVSGDALFTATDTSDNLVLTQQATVTFTVGPVDPVLSKVTASPTSVAADGSSKSTITVLLRDGNDSPVRGKTVTVSSSRGGVDTIAPAAMSSDTAGQATFTIASSTTGNAVLTATDTSDNLTLAQKATVTFTTPGGGPAPTPSGPPNGTHLSNLGPTLTWSQPLGTTWFEITVVPFNDDGPGINLVIGDTLQVAASQYQVREPNFASSNPNYVMLPDLTYTWRVRTATTLGSPTSADWSAWSAPFTFTTAAKTSGTISRVSPTQDSTVGSRNPTLVWDNSDKAVFYYEVQVSKDLNFSNAPGAPFLYWELRHAGLTNPLNSYTIPSPSLEAGATYYWRVRPRIQGNGTPVAWSSTFSFRTP